MCSSCQQGCSEQRHLHPVLTGDVPEGFLGPTWELIRHAAFWVFPACGIRTYALTHQESLRDIKVGEASIYVTCEGLGLNISIYNVSFVLR